MKKLAVLISVVGVCPIFSVAQNLVPNPSFEEYVNCPNDYGQAAWATGWFQCMASADLYNVCSDTAGVPQNLFGNQSPADGDGYIGMTVFTNCECPSGTHENVGIRLPFALQVGTVYWASLKVSRTAGYVSYQTRSKYAVNGLGILCGMDSLGLASLWDPLPNRAHVFSEAIITDTVDWVTISGSFVADSAYQWLYIGNFFSDDSTAHVLVDPEGDEFSHYFVDDVCLSTQQGECLMPTANAEVSVRAVPRAWVVAGSRAITVASLAAGRYYHFELFDAMGKLITQGRLSSDGTIPLRGVNHVVVLRLWDGSEELRFKLPVLSTDP